MVTSLGAEPLRLHGGVDRRHAAADHHDAAADRQLGEILGLPELGDEVDRVDRRSSSVVLAGKPELVDAGEADAEEHGVVVARAGRPA